MCRGLKTVARFLYILKPLPTYVFNFFGLIRTITRTCQLGMQLFVPALEISPKDLVRIRSFLF